VPEGLPPVLAQGLFAKPGRHEAILRFSTSPGDLLDDRVSSLRGLAIKVFGVDGPRLTRADAARTQDFVLVNGKAFVSPNAKAFLANLALLASTTDKAEGLKIVLSAALQGLEHLVEAAGGDSVVLRGLGGQPETNVLGESYFSLVPLRYGDHIAKVGVRPISPELMALTGVHVDLHHKPDGLREAVRSFFAGQGGEWEFVVQLSTNLEEMPVEDAHKSWPEDVSPYIPVARLTVPTQDAWNEGRQPMINDALCFSPWHGLADHQPLGSIMRVRRAVYEASARFRLTRNGCPLGEPDSPQAVGA
ncbi:MAG: catalase family protein, partial [Caulobacteraceae bacterium]